jgi:hypothetical protein
MPNKTTKAKKAQQPATPLTARINKWKQQIAVVTVRTRKSFKEALALNAPFYHYASIAEQKMRRDELEQAAAKSTRAIIAQVLGEDVLDFYVVALQDKFQQSLAQV